MMGASSSSQHPPTPLRTRLASLCAVVNAAAIVIILALPAVASLIGRTRLGYRDTPRLILVTLALTLWNSACLALWVGKGTSGRPAVRLCFWLAVVDAFFFPSLLLLYILASVFLHPELVTIHGP